MTNILKGRWTAHSWLPMGWRAARSFLCNCSAPVMSASDNVWDAVAIRTAGQGVSSGGGAGRPIFDVLASNWS